MRHYATAAFWEAYERLPVAVRSLADRNFERLRTDPSHPSLRYKTIGRYRSARIGLGYRALGVQDGEDVVWFWIGSHAEYDRLIR